jgi:Ethylbenzene dehydrogenase/Prokaryotic cytochrome b561
MHLCDSLPAISIRDGNTTAGIYLLGREVGQRRSTKKTDYGTVILHWLLVGSLAVAIATGLRIASEAPDRDWINVFDLILPKASVWTEHMQAALLLIAVTIAYAVYISRVGLGQRLRLDNVRLKGLLGRRHARWGTINIALHWLFFLVMMSQLVTGTLMYLGYAGSVLVQIHWIGMWTILGYVVLHLVFQWQYGGIPQLLRIFRPAKVAPAPPQFELADALTLLDEQSAKAPARAPQTVAPAFADEFESHGGSSSIGKQTDYWNAAGRDKPATRVDTCDSLARTPGKRVIQLNSFVVAIAIACVTILAMLASERQMIDHLYIHRIDPAEAPLIDGETSDPVWRKIPAVHVRTTNGGNFQGTGETTISIQAVHDGTHAYFLFIWDDPTRSLKQLPLRKTGVVWELLHEGYEAGDERAYNEDKFSVLLTNLNTILAGDATFHAGAAPLAGAPATLSGRGLHYTMHEGLFADVWEWKATSTNASKHCDDDYFGPPAKATHAQFEGLTPYHGGFSPDPGTANYQDNFAQFPIGEHVDGVVPRRVPKDLKAQNNALGRIDLHPDHGESEGAHWYLTEDESVPFSPDRDLLIPDGAIVPGVIISGEYEGDRADVKCAGRWAAGRWALEVERHLEVESRYDVPIRTGIFMRVAAFDHSQIRHTRHVRALRLEVE